MVSWSRTGELRQVLMVSPGELGLFIPLLIYYNQSPSYKRYGGRYEILYFRGLQPSRRYLGTLAVMVELYCSSNEEE
jgi:hypothetical protein